MEREDSGKRGNTGITYKEESLWKKSIARVHKGELEGDEVIEGKGWGRKIKVREEERISLTEETYG